MSEKTLTHIDEKGAARMVDVSSKDVSRRRAVASVKVRMSRDTLEAIEKGLTKKGDVLAAARIAGICGAKRTAELIPLCHNIVIDEVGVELSAHREDGRAWLEVTAEAVATGRTGVEMEALTACSVAALTVYDMCKAVDRGMVIDELRLESKEGGRSGEWRRTR